MRQLISDIRRSYEAGIYSTALVATLSLPDACARIEYPDITRVGERYTRWYGTFVEHRLDLMNHLSPDTVYKLRCGVSHELKIDDAASRVDEVFFALPQERVNRIAVTQFGYHGRSALVIDLGGFIGDVTSAVERWLASAEAEPAKAERLKALLQFETTVLDESFGSIPALA